MSLPEDVNAAITAAMKAKDAPRLATLRMLKAALMNKEVERGRALGFLARCQTPQGGISYAPGSDDICSWSTMFTLQAVEWFVDGPRVDELL